MTKKKTKEISTHIKRVLWATDFSRESRACLPYIRFLSEKLKTENHALYVLPRFADWVYETAFFNDEELLKTIESTKEKSIKKMRGYSSKSDINFTAGVIEGLASEELLKYAGQNDIDLIFAGRRGMSEIEQILVGSTTSRLIRNSRIPIMVIPKAKRTASIENILSPIDLGDTSLLELRYSISLAKQLGAKLYVTHVTEFFNYKVPVLKRDQLLEKIGKKIESIAEEYEFKVTDIIFEYGEPAQKIIEMAKKRKIDLIPMATYQRKGIEKLFLGSIAEKVLMYSDIPVLILPPSKYDLS